MGASDLKRFEFRVPGYGLKYCKLNSEVHDSQLVTRNTQQKNKSITPTLVKSVKNQGAYLED